MRSTSGFEEARDEPTPVGDPQCPWCHGTGQVGVADTKYIAQENLLDKIALRRAAVFIPMTTVTCPKCLPQGMKLPGKRPKKILTLADVVERIGSGTLPYPYLKLLTTCLYVRLLQETDPANALQLINSVPGMGESQVMGDWMANLSRKAQSSKKTVADTAARLTPQEKAERNGHYKKDLTKVYDDIPF